jgi:hypothetical protein
MSLLVITPTKMVHDLERFLYSDRRIIPCGHVPFYRPGEFTQRSKCDNCHEQIACLFHTAHVECDVQHDAFCVAATIHALLFGQYIEVQKVQPLGASSREALFRPRIAVPNRCKHKGLWDRTFRSLLNCPLPPERPDMAPLIAELGQVRAFVLSSCLSILRVRLLLCTARACSTSLAYSLDNAGPARCCSCDDYAVAVSSSVHHAGAGSSGTGEGMPLAGHGSCTRQSCGISSTASLLTSTEGVPTPAWGCGEGHFALTHIVGSAEGWTAGECQPLSAQVQETWVGL